MARYNSHNMPGFGDLVTWSGHGSARRGETHCEKCGQRVGSGGISVGAVGPFDVVQCRSCYRESQEDSEGDRLLRTSTHKARKDHTCTGCNKPIPKGEAYQKLVYVNPFEESKVCQDCEGDEYESEDEGPDYGGDDDDGPDCHQYYDGTGRW